MILILSWFLTNLNLYSPGMALQLLELLDAVQNKNNAHEVEIHELCLMQHGKRTFPTEKSGQSINFRHAQLA